MAVEENLSWNNLMYEKLHPKIDMDVIIFPSSILIMILLVYIHKIGPKIDWPFYSKITDRQTCLVALTNSPIVGIDVILNVNSKHSVLE